MEVDETSGTETSVRSGEETVNPSVSPKPAAVQVPHYIRTWPLTNDEIDEIEGELKSAEKSPEPTRDSEQALLKVQQWPEWLQKQWLATQRRRAWQIAHPPTLARRLTSPRGILAASLLLIIAIGSFGFGAALNAQGSSAGTSSTSNSGGSMSGSSNTTSQRPTNVPDATQQYGNQPAKFVIDPDGVKHFTLTAEQVMWQPVKGQKVLAWTLDGTVPGPTVRATAGDHVRITIVNHLPEATAIHWHGLEVPTDNDGVPPIGMKPIQPGQSYTYDFTLQDVDAGTHWYHSHYDDLKQVGGGMYGAFIVDPRPGSPEYLPMMRAERADVDQTMFIGTLGAYYVINGKSFPDTQPVVVKHGQTVHLRLIGADTLMIHPMHLHGHSFQIVAEDGHLLPAPITKDTVEVAPGETFDLTFYAWAAPGSVYPFHCHILSHLMNPGQQEGEMGGLIVLIKYAS
jgi:FtsP/CotA-like multicopper oxidase with cupredoxin domain